MRRMLAVLVMLFTVPVVLMPYDADAGRLGGGKSIGMKRDVPAAAQAARPSAAPSVAQRPQTTGGFSRWLAPLAGFALGAALMSMFGSSPLMGAIMNILLLVLVFLAVRYAINLWRSRSASGARGQPMQYAGVASGAAPERAASPERSSGTTGTPSTPAVSDNRYPPGFDVAEFSRQAKVSFIRMQAANDAKDLRDIRDFTTPELYAELAMQINERGGAAQRTEVMSLESDLVDFTVEQERAIASVRFTGQVREDPSAAPEQIDEIWHVVKDLKDPKATWLIAGIQQAKAPSLS
jgi:predicted lipid-binding transport protein (Tim44 family)